MPDYEGIRRYLPKIPKPVLRYFHIGVFFCNFWPPTSPNDRKMWDFTRLPTTFQGILKSIRLWPWFFGTRFPTCSGVRSCVFLVRASNFESDLRVQVSQLVYLVTTFPSVFLGVAPPNPHSYSQFWPKWRVASIFLFYRRFLWLLFPKNVASEWYFLRCWLRHVVRDLRRLFYTHYLGFRAALSISLVG